MGDGVFQDEEIFQSVRVYGVVSFEAFRGLICPKTKRFNTVV